MVNIAQGWEENWNYYPNGDRFNYLNNASVDLINEIKGFNNDLF